MHCLHLGYQLTKCLIWTIHWVTEVDAENKDGAFTFKEFKKPLEEYYIFPCEN